MNTAIDLTLMLLSIATLFGGAMLLIVTPSVVVSNVVVPSIVVFGLTIGIALLLFPKTVIA